MIGIDEVGRGAFAGPLLVCAVRANNTQKISGLTDSKLLSPKKRAQIAKQIIANYEVGYGWVDANYIDNFGLTMALNRACFLAVAQLKCLNTEEIILDGNVNYLNNYNCKTIVKADLLIPIVSAASVVAKYTRDTHMINLAKKYTKYSFDSNKGYGTKKHIECIKQYGVCKEHRRLFLKKYINT